MYTIEIKNLEQIQQLWDKFPVEVSNNFNKAIGEVLLIAQRYAIMGSPVDTGKLRGGFEINVELMSGTLANKTDYAYWVAVGRQAGTFPPISAIKKWAERKGLNPYAVAKSIAKKGTPANPFWQNALDLTGRVSDKIFADALAQTLKDIKK